MRRQYASGGRWLRTAGPAALLASLLTWGLGAAPAEAIFAGFTAPAGGADDGGATSAAHRSVRAHCCRTGERIDVDGRLNEALWQRAVAATGFQQWSPERGRPASQQTVFKVAYDQDALYFAVACHEQDPGEITGRLTRRDQLAASDNVAIYIDPYCDRTSGYHFCVNPLGVQEDAYVFNDGESDFDWDAVWEAETFRDADGWYTEVRIPFSSIRYRPDVDSWGLQVFRYMHNRGENTAWVVWDRETAGFVSRFGALDGIHGIPAPRQLEVLPYAVARVTDPAVHGPEENDSFQNFGLDLKYGITADLTLNATFQPDFGQVEADPATLNLSPFETYYTEKRPFFVEGNRFFEHPNFNLFYSRRIGTGSENARIRYAAKLTGKTAHDISLAGLVAGTDLTRDGQTHNFLKSGGCAAQYMVARLGKEFNQGNQKIRFMQTAVYRSGARAECGDAGSREAYTSGLDFELLFRDRQYSLAGSAVGSILAPEPLEGDPAMTAERRYGTGGHLSLNKHAGHFRGSIWGHWESDRLALNDIGFLSAPDEINAGLWCQYRYTPDGTSAVFHQGSFNLNLNGDFLYAGRTGYDLHTGERVWSYGRGHRANPNTNINGWMQLRNHAETWFGISFNPEGSQRYDTRDWVYREDGSAAEIPGGGPLIDEPWTWGGWWGAHTDGRKELIVGCELNYYDDEARNVSRRFSADLEWNQSSALRHNLSASYRNRIDDTQHLANFENRGAGIGGVSYVYGVLHQEIVSLTFRSSILFGRNRSLEIYAQPYLTTGDYRAARELMRPDSYDLAPYAAEGFDVDGYDFRFAAVNFNAVYRWEYRPGSTLYLVWAHSRESWDQRSEALPAGRFDDGLEADALFRNEPENTFLVKLSYWLPL